MKPHIIVFNCHSSIHFQKTMNDGMKLKREMGHQVDHHVLNAVTSAGIYPIQSRCTDSRITYIGGSELC